MTLREGPDVSCRASPDSAPSKALAHFTFGYYRSALATPLPPSTARAPGGQYGPALTPVSKKNRLYHVLPWWSHQGMGVPVMSANGVRRLTRALLLPLARSFLLELDYRPDAGSVVVTVTASGGVRLELSERPGEV